MSDLLQDLPTIKVMEDPGYESRELWRAVNAFIAWLERHGYASYDPYDIWGTAYGLFSRRLYYRRSVFGLPLIAPVLAMEVLCPQARRLLVRKQRFATADAQLILAFANLHQLTGKAVYLAQAKSLAAELAEYSASGYSGLCWGYPFDWGHVNGMTPRNTPFITTTPYCFEAFLQLFDITGEALYAEQARSVAAFVYSDLNDTPHGENSMAGSYSPMDMSKVVNASAYRAMVLFEAARRFGVPGYAEKARGNLNFILSTQQDDGSWLYAIDNPPESFIDHFHTCFVLKNLVKILEHLEDEALRNALHRGYAFYQKSLFHEDRRPRSYSIEPRMQITRFEMYNFAEAITLGSILHEEIPDAFALAQQLAGVLCREYQCRDGHFVTRVYFGGWRHTFPFLRWPQAQLFYSLTNLLGSLEL